VSGDSAFCSLPGVVFYGPVGIMSGLGSASRGYLAALRAAAIPTSVVPVHELFIHQPSIGKIAAPRGPSGPVAIVHVNPGATPRFLHYQGKAFARASYKIGLWVWELPAFRDEWFEELGLFDEFWVPSTFVMRAVEAVTAKPVTLAPHVVPLQTARRDDWRGRFGLAEDGFVFLYIFDASSVVERKNPQCLVDAFEAVFSPKDNVRLVLKVLHPEQAADFSSYLGALVARNPNVTVLRENLSADELAGLVAACDCYVSPHRSEGFGLTVAEAMASGKSVIATPYGGVADFLTEDVGYPLQYKLTEVGSDFGPYAKGAIWADPSREHLGQLLREVVADRVGAALKAERARNLMRERYSAAAVGRRLGERLTAIAESQRAQAR